MASAQEGADLVSCSSSVTDPQCHSAEASQRAARLHCRSEPLTPRAGTAPAPFSHTHYERHQGRQKKIWKSAWNPTSVWIPISPMEFTWTWDSLLKLLHPCLPACSQQITDLEAETNWAAQYVRYNFYRGAAGSFFLHSAKPISAGGTAQCALIAALITQMGSDATSTTEHPHFLPCASPGGHRAPDESRDLGETSPGRNNQHLAPAVPCRSCCGCTDMAAVKWKGAGICSQNCLFKPTSVQLLLLKILTGFATEATYWLVRGR